MHATRQYFSHHRFSKKSNLQAIETLIGTKENIPVTNPNILVKTWMLSSGIDEFGHKLLCTSWNWNYSDKSHDIDWYNYTILFYDLLSVYVTYMCTVYNGIWRKHVNYVEWNVTYFSPIVINILVIYDLFKNVTCILL